jgi:hypothetical protein
MAQIILIESNQTLKDLLTLNLVTYTGAEVIPRESAKEAIELMDILPNIDLVICPVKTGAEKTAEILGTYLMGNDNGCGLIVLGDGLPANLSDSAVNISNGQNWEKVVESSLKILGISEEHLRKKIQPDYLPVPIHYFYSISSTCCDVFIRLKKGPDTYQYIKRLHQGDNFTKKTIDRYITQGLSHLHIPKDFQKNFTNFVSDQLVEKLNNFEGTEEEHIELIGNSYDVAIQEIKKMGFNGATIQLTESIIDGMIETAKNSPDMSPLLHKVINSKSGYLYQNGHMASIVASECLKKLGLDKPELHEKMAYAAFFHDISLCDNEELAKITSYEDLEASELDEEHWDMAFNHALESSLILAKHTEAPEGAADIIKHHHGSLNGKGYSTTGANKIPRLSKIFLVSCEFSSELLAYKEHGGPPRPIIKNLFQKFQDEEIAKVIHVLELTLKKKAKKPA